MFFCRTIELHAPHCTQNAKNSAVKFSKVVNATSLISRFGGKARGGGSDPKRPWRDIKRGTFHSISSPQLPRSD